MDEAAAECARWLSRRPGSKTALRLSFFLLPYRQGIGLADIRRETEAALAQILMPARSTLACRAAGTLRIGWLSANLSAHPVGRNLLPVIEAMSARHFFYSDTKSPDEVTQRFRSFAAGWRETRRISDADTAEMIRQDQIDVLMILAARFDDNRFALAMQRAAPVQIAMHDVATSCLPNMDCLILDRFLVPAQSRVHYSERVVRLPSFYVHHPLQGPEIRPPPSERNGFTTFGCLNNPAKITSGTLELWAGILNTMPQSRLLLAYGETYDDAEIYRRITRPLLATGMSRDRLIVHRKKRDRVAQLDLYNSIDIALDPLPFSGSTTTFEALSMGVPVITLAGEAPASRWSGSMLRALGLESMITGSGAAYIQTALEMAKDGPARRELRQTLRARVAASPLCDGKKRASQILRLLRSVVARQTARPPTAALS